jgi:hypothetical protein
MLSGNPASGEFVEGVNNSSSPLVPTSKPNAASNDAVGRRGERGWFSPECGGWKSSIEEGIMFDSALLVCSSVANAGTE